MRNTLRRSRGFTLIELLVVILIIAILAALIVPRIVNRSDQAKVAAAHSDISALRGMLHQFKLDTGRYPTTEEGLQALRVAPSDVQGWKGPYSDKDIPMDPWNHEYVYQYPGTEGDDSFLLISYGADGAEGGEGDNADIQ
jgi:general secretion pathway protein G